MVFQRVFHKDWDNYVARERQKEIDLQISRKSKCKDSSKESCKKSENDVLQEIETEKDQASFGFEKSIVRNKLRSEIEGTVRNQVENMMRDELEQLRAILDKKGKGKKGKGKGGKKGKKGKKEKKEKDPTGGQSLESMESDLIMNGIMTYPPRKEFKEIIGCHQVLTGEKIAGSSLEPGSQVITPPCLNDLKSLLVVHGALPIKSSDIVEELETRVRSILLVGPKASCKRSLL